MTQDEEYGFYRSVIRALLFVFLLYLAYDIGWEGRLSRIQWSYLFPIVAFPFLGKKEGLCWSAAFLAVMFVLMVFSSAGMEMSDFKLRYGMTVFAVCVIVFCGEHALEVTYARFVRQQKRLKESENRYREAFEGLQKEMEERRQVQQALVESEEELRKSHSELEMRVRERTAELEEAVTALRTADCAKSDFLANMSHELRTPLNHILGFTELVVDKKFGDLNPTQEEYLLDVLQSSRHLLSLVNDVLDLSKVEAGKMELKPSEVNLRDLLESSLVMVREKATKHAIRLSIESEGLPEVVQIDERKLKQVMYNLLSNAVKFTPDGGSVTVRARQGFVIDDLWPRGGGETIGPAGFSDFRAPLKGRCIEISVRDTGIGIVEDDLKRIFDPFEQGDNSIRRKYQGTGLGLSLTRKLLELHGGAIRAESNGVGKGSVFRFLLPIEACVS